MNSPPSRCIFAYLAFSTFLLGKIHLLAMLLKFPFEILSLVCEELEPEELWGITNTSRQLRECTRQIVDRKREEGLQWCSENRQTARAELILYYVGQPTDEKVFFSMRDKNGRTPASHAARRGHVRTMRKFFDCSDRVGIDRVLSDDYCAQTMISHAAEQGHAKVLELLVERITRIEDAQPLGFYFDLYKCNDPYMEDGGPATALAFAAKHGYEEITRLILDHGGRANTGERTPLSYAAENGHEAITQLLLEHGADPARDNNELASRAAKNGHCVMTQLVLNHNTDPDKREETPLSRAADNGYGAVVQLLLNHGANPDAYGDDQSPIIHAAKKGHEAIVTLLLNKGADPDTGTWNPFLSAMDSSLRTPLSHAAEKGYAAIARRLISNHATVNTYDQLLRTPLSYAAEQGHVEIVKLLLDADAIVDKTDIFDKDPLWYATARNHMEAAKLLAGMSELQLAAPDIAFDGSEADSSLNCRPLAKDGDIPDERPGVTRPSESASGC